MSDLKLGSIIEGKQHRDAIHIAVAPVVAGEALEPGAHVGLVDGKAVVLLRSPIGIVDPFLKAAVKPGETFWLFLYPGTIKGLRHEWTHPAFDEDTDKDYSEQWLRSYAVKMNPYDAHPDAAYRRLIDGLKSGEIYAYGSDLHGLYDLDDSDELRLHAERVLGIRVDWERYAFSCSC